MILNYFKPQMYGKRIVAMHWSVSIRIPVSCCSRGEIYETVENLACQERPPALLFPSKRLKPFARLDSQPAAGRCLLLIARYLC